MNARVQLSQALLGSPLQLQSVRFGGELEE
jgi:hypothetical protein